MELINKLNNRMHKLMRRTNKKKIKVKDFYSITPKSSNYREFTYDIFLTHTPKNSLIFLRDSRNSQKDSENSHDRRSEIRFVSRSNRLEFIYARFSAKPSKYPRIHSHDFFGVISEFLRIHIFLVYIFLRDFLSNSEISSGNLIYEFSGIPRFLREPRISLLRNAGSSSNIIT